MKGKVIHFWLLLLFCCGLIVSCDKKVFEGPVSKVQLGQSISAAIKLLTTAREGAASENYVRGSQSQFAAAINAAQLVYAGTSTQQADYDAANAALFVANELYKTQKVHEPSITRLILSGGLTCSFSTPTDTIEPSIGA